MLLTNSAVIPPVSDTNDKTYQIEAVSPSGGIFYRLVKRIFDILISLVAGIILFPVLLIIGLLIRIDSPGKAIYVQERIGKNSKPFRMLKFRTMVEDAEQGTPVWADTNDPRCTRLGKKLRECRIDELPQLWNIFVGDMSVIGPRPERQCFYDQFETYIHGFSNRLAVKPGLTGLAQVNGGYDLLPEEKIVYDMEYIKKRTVWMDIKILCKTVKVICKKEGVK